MQKSLIYKQTANLLTLSRLILGLPLILLLSNGNIKLAWIVILVGAFTDLLDGIFARMSGRVNPVGARIDPIADKIFLIAPILWISSKGILPLWSLWLLLSREFFISTWRKDIKSGVPASNSAKIKTILQFISILLLLWPIEWLGQELKYYFYQVGLISFWASLALAIISGYRYLKSK